MISSEITKLIGEADPVTSVELESPEITSALNALGADLRTAHQGPVADRRHAARRVRRRRGAVAVVVAFALAATTAAAVANSLLARTGEQSPGGELGTGELIRLDARDVREVLRDLGADIPLPPGGSFDAVTPDDIEPSISSESGLLGVLEYNAACQWSSYWLESQAAGNASAISTAQTMLDRLPHRAALVGDSDPPEAARLYWQAVADAARTNNAQIFRDSGYTTNCSGIGLVD